MIDFRSLRVGNRVLYEANFHIVEQILEHTAIHRWLGGGTGPIGDGYYSSYRDLEPVPITKDWLLAMGFVELEDGHFSLHVLDILFEHQSGVMSLALGDFSQLPAILSHVKHVHQVQNIYYSLIGKEILL